MSSTLTEPTHSVTHWYLSRNTYWHTPSHTLYYKGSQGNTLWTPLPTNSFHFLWLTVKGQPLSHFCVSLRVTLRKNFQSWLISNWLISTRAEYHWVSHTFYHTFTLMSHTVMQPFTQHFVRVCDIHTRSVVWCTVDSQYTGDSVKISRWGRKHSAWQLRPTVLY